MTDFIQKYIVPLGVILTFIVSIVSIYYTRRNLKTTKYIDTITSERVKWIEKVRIEIAEILAEMQEFLRLKYFILSKKAENNIVESKEIEVLIDNLHSIRDKDFKINELEQELNKISKIDLIKKLQLLKLRLNSFDDTEIIDILDYYILILTVNCDRKQTEDGWDKLSKLVELTQKMLKNEWERVKKETMK